MARARLERAANLLMNGGREAQLANHCAPDSGRPASHAHRSPLPFSRSLGAGAPGAVGETQATAPAPVLATAPPTPHPRPGARSRAVPGAARPFSSRTSGSEELVNGGQNAGESSYLLVLPGASWQSLLGAVSNRKWF